MALSINTIDTPAVLIDVDRVEPNLTRAQDYADAHGLQPPAAHQDAQDAGTSPGGRSRLGAIGITCQKIGEAEVMADAGIDDIFLPYNIVGRRSWRGSATLRCAPGSR